MVELLHAMWQADHHLLRNVVRVIGIVRVADGPAVDQIAEANEQALHRNIVPGAHTLEERRQSSCAEAGRAGSMLTPMVCHQSRQRLLV